MTQLFKRRRTLAVSLISTLGVLMLLGAVTVFAICNPGTSYSVTSSAPPPIGNWTDTSGAVWAPAGGFPGCATGDSAADTNGSPTTLVINSAIPNPIVGLNLSCTGCTIDIQSGGSLTLAGTGTVSNSSTIIVEPGGTLTIANGGALTFNAGTSLSVNGGTVDLQSMGTLTLNGASTVANGGTLNVDGGTLSIGALLIIQSNGTLEFTAGSVTGAGTINNNGTVQMVGSGTFPVSSILNNNPTGSVTVSSGTLALTGGGTGNGPFTIASGATLDFPGSTYTMTASGTVSGAGTLSVSGGTLSIGGITSPGGFTMSAGTLTGSGFLSIANTMTWHGGTITGTGGSQLNGGATGTITGALGPITLDGREFDDYGSISYFATTNSLQLLNNGTLGVFGSFTFLDDGSISGTGTVKIAPNGTLLKSAGAGTSTISTTTITNDSLVVGSSGTLEIAGSGTHNGGFLAVAPGTLRFSAATTTCNLSSSISGGGTIAFPSGSTVDNGTYLADGLTSITGGSLLIGANSGSTKDLTFTGGTLQIVPGATFQMTGSGTWSGGTLHGSGAFQVAGGATLTIDAATGSPNMTSLIFNNDGKVNYTAGGPNFLSTSGSTINNTGLFDIKTDVQIQSIGSFSALSNRIAGLPMPSTFNNSGTLRKSAAAGTMSFALNLNNSGNVKALSGTLNFIGPSYTQTAGATTLGPGNIGVTPPMTLNGGLLNGAGTITGNVQNNSAQVLPGGAAATGTINLTGNYTQQAGGTLGVELAGPAMFDVLAVGGSVTLDGTLNATLLGGYTPANGTVFPVLTFASRTGDFAVKNLPTYPVHGSISASYTPTELDLIATVAPLQSDLAASMGGPATVNAGAPLSYTVDILNNGADPTSGTTTVSDTLPAGATAASGSGSGWSCGAPSGGVITCTSTAIIGSASSFPTLTIAMTAPVSGGSVSNSATISNANDPNGANNTASVSTTVVAQADVSITKTGPAGVVAGQNIVYTITVTNNGPSAANAVTVSDPTPANLTFVSNSGACTTAFPCNLGTMTAGQTATITATYSTTPPFSGNVTNTATVSATTADPNNTNNSASATTNVGAQADLSVVKTGPASTNTGQNVTYTVVVTNNGPSPATNTVVNDPTPVGIAFVSNSGACATPFPCNLGTLNAGQSVTITSTYNVPGSYAGVSITNTATVSSSVNDPTGANDSSTATTNVAQQADVAIAKSGPASVGVGQNIVYTITVSNLGPSAAGSVVVSDPTPAGLTFVSNSGACTTAFPCNLGTLNASQSVTITSTFAVPPAYASATVTNTATVTSGANDPTASNNTASVTTPVVALPQSDLSITKTGPPSTNTGQNIVYTITVQNAGPASAASTQVSDPTPAGLTFVSNSGACATPFPCTLGTLASGQTATITSTFNVPSGFTGTSIVNTASVSSASSDPNPANNSATATTSVGPVNSDVAIFKNGPGRADPGSSIAFPITITNIGPSAATSVVVNDATPQGLTFVSNTGACTTPFPCNFGTLAAGQSVVITAHYQVTAAVGSSVTNSANVTTASNDPNATNNRSSVTLTVCPTVPPQLVEPAAGTTAGSPVTFSWTAVPGASLYTLTITGSGSPITMTTTSTSLTTALANGNYSWSVQASLVSSCGSLRSATAAFSVCATPAAPIVSVVGALTTGESYSVSWPAIDGTSGYELQESLDAVFSNPTVFPTNALSKSFSKPVLAATRFYYRVRATSACNQTQGAFSTPVSVVVLPLPAPADPNPMLVVPSTGGTPITFPIFIPGLPGGTATFVATADRPWIAVTPSAGIVPPEGTTLLVAVDPSTLTNGTWTGTIIVVYGSTTISSRIAPEGTTSKSIPVSVSLVTPVTPADFSAASNALVVPSVGHISGSDSDWRSDLRVANLSTQSQKYQLTFGTAGSTNVKQTTITADPSSTVAFDDIARNWFGVGATGDSANGVLSLRALDSSGQPDPNISKTTAVTSRTYNASSTGTLGQFIPAIPFANFIGKNDATILSLQHIAQSDAYRTNLGVVETAGKPATVMVSTFDGAGNKLLDVPLSLGSGEQRQLNGFYSDHGITFTNGHAEVKVIDGDGRVTTYASVLDNKNNDPLLVTGLSLSGPGSTRFIVPGIADLNTGFAAWRSDLRIFNSGASPQTATLTFFPNNNPASSVSKTLTINPGTVVADDNLLQSTFGITDVGGTLHVTTPTTASLVVTARTYDQTPAGTLGQFIPALTPNGAVGVNDKALQVLQAEDSVRYRTNLGIAEVSGKPATVEIALALPESKVSPKVQIPLAAFESQQFRIITSFGLGAEYNVRISVRVVDGDGKVTAYGSIVDQSTQAPTYIPAQ